MAAGGPETLVERPAGVTAIAIIFFAAAAYLCAIAFIMLIWPGEVSMASGAVLLHGLETAGPYMFLLTGSIAALIAWGLLRLNSFARWLAMLACMAGFVMLVPVVSMAAMNFGWPLLKSGSQLIVRMVMVWYLSQTPVSERFGKKSKT